MWKHSLIEILLRPTHVVEIDKCLHSFVVHVDDSNICRVLLVHHLQWCLDLIRLLSLDLRSLLELLQQYALHLINLRWLNKQSRIEVHLTVVLNAVHMEIRDIITHPIQLIQLDLVPVSVKEESGVGGSEHGWVTWELGLQL